MNDLGFTLDDFRENWKVAREIQPAHPKVRRIIKNKQQFEITFADNSVMIGKLAQSGKIHEASVSGRGEGLGLIIINLVGMMIGIDDQRGTRILSWFLSDLNGNGLQVGAHEADGVLYSLQKLDNTRFVFSINPSRPTDTSHLVEQACRAALA